MINLLLKKRVLACSLVLVIVSVVYIRIQRMPPETWMDTKELAALYNIPFESHTVATAEGETISVFRIPNPGRKPVLLHHGVVCTARNFVILGRGSLAYRLYAIGFDVWLVNSRETFYSRPNTDDYDWHYTFDDMALLDLP
jgi:hypothetical protein